MKREVLSWLKSIFIALIVVFICRQFLFVPVTVKGESMEPTFENSDRIVVTKIGSVKHSDMVVFHAPDADKEYIKRVIGLEGDRVKMQDDVLYINDKPYKEPYVKANKEQIPPNENLTENFDVKVPKGKLFVMGDNRRHSSDSRTFGVISEDSLVGKVEFRFFPLDGLGAPK